MRYTILLLFVLLAACGQEQNNANTISDKRTVATLKDMRYIDVGGGEAVYQMEGKNFEMNDMSFVITETKVGGGPPLHIHPTEEAHIVLSGKVKYIVGDSIFTVEAPYIVKIPPNTKHTFMNVGDTTLNLIGAFGHDNFGPYRPLAENPLFEK